MIELEPDILSFLSSYSSKILLLSTKQNSISIYETVVLALAAKWTAEVDLHMKFFFFSLNLGGKISVHMLSFYSYRHMACLCNSKGWSLF